MTATPFTDRSAEDHHVFDAHLAAWEARDRADAAADAEIEAVARAICEADGDVDGTLWTWEQTGPDARADYRRLAAAAVAAVDEHRAGQDEACDPRTCRGHSVGDGITSGGRVQHISDPYRPAAQAPTGHDDGEGR